MNTQYRKNLKAVMEKSKEYTDNIYTLATNNTAGKDTSTNILAKTSNQGVWVGSDTGHWYYWNGTQYADGGVYQTAVGYDELSKISDKELSDTIVKPTVGNYFYNYPYDFVVGKTYRISIDNYDGNYGIAFYTRLTEGGENLETITTFLTDGNYIDFTPQTNASFLRVVSGTEVPLTFHIYDLVGVRHKIEKLENEKENKIDILNKYSGSISSGSIIPFEFRIGKKYKLTNVSTVSYTINAFTRIQRYSNNLETICSNMDFEESIIFTPINEAHYLYVVGNANAIFEIEELGTISNRLDILEENESNVYIGKTRNLHNPRTDIYGYIIGTDGIVVENAGYGYTDYIEVEEDKKISMPTWDGTNYGNGAKDVCLYDSNKNFIRRISDVPYSDLGYTFTVPSGVKYIRINIFYKTYKMMVNYGDNLLDYEEYDEYRYDEKISGLVNDIKKLEKIPPVVFEIDHSLKNVSNILEEFDFNDKYNQNDVMEQVYNAFDGLISSYSNYVSRVDCGELLNLEYPTYASNYRTYMYKLEFSNPDVGTDKYKKKILLVGGTHGNEIAAPVNLYILAKQLCESFIDDVNFYKLRSSFDFYIIPCLNGYGMNNLTRGNGNKVNINRNYPTIGWRKGGSETKDSAGSNEYTGENAGSEFETQVVMGITNLISPDICIDHHNYSILEKQFYVEQNKEELLPLVYQSLVDCSYTFKKDLPLYFGNSFELFTSGEAPKETARFYISTTNQWWYEQGIKVSSTVEISENINFLNGVYNATRNDDFGNDAFAVGEYTLRNILLYYCQYVLNNY